MTPYRYRIQCRACGKIQNGRAARCDACGSAKLATVREFVD